MPQHTHTHAADAGDAAEGAEAPLNREQRRAARYRPKAGLRDPHMVGLPGTEDTPPEDPGRVANETPPTGDVQPA